MKWNEMVNANCARARINAVSPSANFRSLDRPSTPGRGAVHAPNGGFVAAICSFVTRGLALARRRAHLGSMRSEPIPMNMMARDTSPVLRQDRPPAPGGIAYMPLKNHARWSEALRSTALLWLFVLVVFLPVIIQRHSGEPWSGVALDCSTILVSMAIAMVMFIASRATIGLPPLLRLPLRAFAVLMAAAVNTTFDLMFQAWIGDHFVDAWQTLPSDFQRAYASTLNYILVFGVNMILFHVNYVRRAGIQQERRIAEAHKRRAPGPDRRACATSSTRISCSIR